MPNHHEIVKRIVESKAVDFNAIGKMVADLGPTLIYGDDPWENFCWTMRIFIHIYRRPFPGPIFPFEDLGKLKEAAGGIR